MEFNLSAGISVENISGVHSAYSKSENGFSAILSSEKILPVVAELVKMLDEPVFFFIEIPDEYDVYKVYYLDNCTAEVAQAILKRYGELLNADGLVRWGFGSHKTEEEIYCLQYQEISVYGDKKFEKAFINAEIPQEDNFHTLWDNFTDETPGKCTAVEFNGETVLDIVENLTEEGLYSC